MVNVNVGRRDDEARKPEAYKEQRSDLYKDLTGLGETAFSLATLLTSEPEKTKKPLEYLHATGLYYRM